MDRGVAAGALPTRLEAEPRVRHTGLHVEARMALQTKLASLAADKQHTVGAAMGVMASRAALDLRCRMFVNERPAFFLVTVRAGLEVWLVKAGGVLAAVRIVAVGALHQVLRHAMMDWQGELGLNRAVATETKLRFGLFEQAVVQPADFVRKLRHLKEVSLRVTQLTLTLIFDRFNQMRAMALVAG